MSNIFPDEVNEAAKALGSSWITASEFEGGLVLQIVKPLEKMVSNNPKYGAKADNYLVKKEILEVGETFRYYFKTVSGEEKQMDSTSSPFFIGIRQVEELGIGDWVKITRTGQTTETRFTVEKVDAPVSQEKEDGIPF